MIPSLGKKSNKGTAAAVIFIAGLLLWAGGSARANSGVELKDPSGATAFGRAIYVFEDASGRLDFQAVRSPANAGKFKQSTRETLNFRFSKSVFWLRFKVVNRSADERDWLLESTHPILDELVLFKPRGKKGYVVSRTGDALPFTQREVKHRNYIFRLRIAPGESKTYYIKVRSSSSISVPLRILTPDAFTGRDGTRQYILGLFYGIVFVMAMYNLFLFFSLRDPSYIFYVLYISFMAMYALCLDGISFQFFWPNAVGWSDTAPVFFLGGTCVFMHLFTRSFLATREHAPVFDKILLGMAGLGTLLTLYTLVGDVGTASTPISLFGMLSVFLSIATGIVVNIRGYKPARYYVFAWAWFLAGAFVYGLRAFGALPTNIFTSYGMQTGHALELILLSLGLAYRINIIKQEKAEAQADALENMRRVHKQKDEFLEELKRLNSAYSRFVPREFVNFLGKDSVVDLELGNQIETNMTISFIDIRSFTSLSESMTPKQNFDFLNSYLRRMGPIIREHGGFIDKYIGDAIMALFPGKPEDALNTSVAIQKAVRAYNEDRIQRGFRPIAVGVGTHTGAMMLGIVGEAERMDGTVISDAVNLAARMENVTKYYRAAITVSGPTLYALQDPHKYNYRMLGVVQVKGKQEPVTVFEIMDGDSEESLGLKTETKKDFEMGIQLFMRKEFKEARAQFLRVLEVNPGDIPAGYYRDRSIFFSKKSVVEDWEIGALDII